MSDPVIIIGGGLGGLSAGVAAAQRGLKVVLLEKEPRLGGYAVAFKRGPYTFDLALHVAPAGGPGEEFDRLAAGLGLRDDVAFLRLHEGFRVLMQDRAIQMPNDYEALFGVLGSEFPAERDNLTAFRKDLEGRVRVYARLFDPTVPKWRSVPPFLPRVPAFLRQTVLDADRYVSRFIRDRRLLSCLFQSSAFMGVPPSEFPTVHFMMMFRLLFRHGLYTIRGGGQALTDALERRLRALGGTVVTGAKVARILVRRRDAVAVRTEEGTEHPAAGVVCAVNLPAVVRDLIGADQFPDSYLSKLSNKLRPSASVSVVNLGLDCHPREAGVANHISVLLPDDDIDVCLKRQRASRLLQGFAVTAPGNSDPSAPPGAANTLSVVGPADARHWPETLSDEEYRAAKELMIEDVLAKLERRFPGIRGHVRFRCAATPRTMARYTGNAQGAILGFEPSCGMHRFVMAVSRLPFRNVFLAGAWTDRLGGFMPSVRSGVEAVDRLASSRSHRERLSPV